MPTRDRSSHPICCSVSTDRNIQPAIPSPSPQLVCWLTSIFRKAFDLDLGTSHDEGLSTSLDKPPKGFFMLPVKRETCLITFLNVSGLCFQLLHLVTLLMALQPPLKPTEDTKVPLAGSGKSHSCRKSTERNEGFGVLIYTETLSSLSGSKNWTQNVQPNPWL